MKSPIIYPVDYSPLLRQMLADYPSFDIDLEPLATQEHQRAIAKALADGQPKPESEHMPMYWHLVNKYTSFTIWPEPVGQILKVHYAPSLEPERVRVSIEEGLMRLYEGVDFHTLPDLLKTISNTARLAIADVANHGEVYRNVHPATGQSLVRRGLIGCTKDDKNTVIYYNQTSLTRPVHLALVAQHAHRQHKRMVATAALAQGITAQNMEVDHD